MFCLNIFLLLVLFPPAAPAEFINVSVSSAAKSNSDLFTSSGKGYMLADKKINIEGTFVIDKDLIVQNCTLNMGVESKIIISKNKTLTLQSAQEGITLLKAGGKIMWDGIYITDKTAYLITNSTGAPLEKNLKRSVILPEAKHSDHCPLLVEVDI